MNMLLKMIYEISPFLAYPAERLYITNAHHSNHHPCICNKTIYSNSSSSFSSSRDLPIVSGSRKVNKRPKKHKAARISKVGPIKRLDLGLPPKSTMIGKNWAAMMAPNLPVAAEIPCAVDRTAVGKTSAG